MGKHSPVVTFGRVDPPWWDERPVYVIGGGPSLAGKDLSRLRRRECWIVGVNRAAEFVECDATFTIDYQFVKNRGAFLSSQAQRSEVYVGVERDWDEPPLPGVVYLERRRDVALSVDPSVVANGLNSGYGAINLAVLKHAKKIYLLGFDLVPPLFRGRTHWHDGYEWDNGHSLIYYQRWAKRFDDLAQALPPGVEVVNANPRSAVRAFPFCRYEDLGL